MKTQTLVILPKLTAMLAAPMSDIPNKAGFMLLGIMKTGVAMPLKVRIDANGCHYLADQHHTHRLPSMFTGWVKDTAI